MFLGDRGKMRIRMISSSIFGLSLGRITPLQTAYSADEGFLFLFPPPPILFLPTVLGGPLGVFLAEHFFLPPLLGERTPLSLAHGYNVDFRLTQGCAKVFEWAMSLWVVRNCRILM